MGRVNEKPARCGSRRIYDLFIRQTDQNPVAIEKSQERKRRPVPHVLPSVSVLIRSKRGATMIQMRLIAKTALQKPRQSKIPTIAETSFLDGTIYRDPIPHGPFMQEHPKIFLKKKTSREGLAQETLRIFWIGGL